MVFQIAMANNWNEIMNVVSQPAVATKFMHNVKTICFCYLLLLIMSIMVIVVVSIPGCGQPQQLWPSHLLHILLYDPQHAHNKVIQSIIIYCIFFTQ